MQLFFSSWLFIAAIGLLASPLQAAKPAAPWVATWAAATRDYNQPPIPGIPPPAALSLRDQTVRMRVLPAIGGNEVRVRFSNVFGTTALSIRSASVARSTGADAVSPGSLQALHIDGRSEFTIAPGRERWSDPVRLAVEPQQALALSVYVAEPVSVATVFSASDVTAWIADGDATQMAVLRTPGPSAWGHVISGVDVARRPSPVVLVAFGDSITQGTGAISYPARLALRLQGADPRRDAASILNVGIGGNRLLADGTGPKALARFERDVLQQSGVTHTLILIGTNDIGTAEVLGSDAAPLASLTAGLQQLIDSARRRGVKVLVGTLTPFKGSAYFTEATESKRQALNHWIRARKDIDAVIDFDEALRDPDHGQALSPAYDSGDHLHPSDAGYAAMAAAVDLRALRR